VRVPVVATGAVGRTGDCGCGGAGLSACGLEHDSESAASWARRLLGEEIAEEVQAVYEQAKRILKLKSREISKDEDEGVGSVDTEIFRWEISAGQSRDEPGEAAITLVKPGFDPRQSGSHRRLSRHQRGNRRAMTGASVFGVGNFLK
jgi:hypothetical protein